MHEVQWTDGLGNTLAQDLTSFPTIEDVPVGAVRMDVALPIAGRQTRFLRQAAEPVGKYDEVLRPFFLLMEKELRANSGKGDRPGWLAMDANTALLEVYWHVAKLSAAVKNNDGPAIQEHSADVANMAMMVLDVCGGFALMALEQTE
ncbi:MAG TPA: hypothetical protein VE934_12160 [Polaromonas sp.]|nr:hypothetical protein [Polaromonas sp.]